MSDADALLDAIFADPDADTPRLVYADWLDDHGQPDCAAFIRLQVEAARHPVWSAEANRLWEGIGGVWSRLADDWRDLLFRLPELDAADFHRGLLREPIRWETVYEHLDCLDVCGPLPPLVTARFYVDDDTGDVPNFGRLPPHRLDHLRHFRFDLLGYVEAIDRGVLAGPRFRHLQVLDLREAEWSPGYGYVNRAQGRPWAELLLSADHLTRVPQLLLPSERDQDPAVLAALRERFPGARFAPDPEPASPLPFVGVDPPEPTTP